MRKQAKVLSLVILLGFLLLHSDAAFSQENQHSASTTVWGSSGVGFGSVVAGTLDLSIQHKALLFTVRSGGAVSPEMLWFGTGDIFSVKEHGVLVGLAKSDKNYLTSFSAGVSRLEMDRAERIFFIPVSDRRQEKIVGFPMELQAVWKATDFLGLGVSAFANLNSEKSYGGVAVKLVIGKLR